MKHKCPVCHKAIKILPQEKAEGAGFFPFCSRRCKLIDLGAWLEADYKIVSQLQPEQESDRPPHLCSDATAGEQ